MANVVITGSARLLGSLLARELLAAGSIYMMGWGTPAVPGDAHRPVAGPPDPAADQQVATIRGDPRQPTRLPELFQLQNQGVPLVRA